MVQIDDDTEDQRNRITSLLMGQDIAEHQPTDIFPHSPAPGDQLALSQLSDPDTAITDQSFGPIVGAPTPDNSLQGIIDALTGGRTPGSKGDDETGVPGDAGKSSGIFDPGAMTTSIAALTPGASWEGAGFPNATDMFSPTSNALVSDIAEEGPMGVWDFSPTAPPDATPDPDMPGETDFASMAPDPAAAAFSAGFDVGAASVGGGQGEGAGQGDTTGGSSSSDGSSSSGDTTGGSSGVG
jgi:hypothetical protein